MTAWVDLTLPVSPSMAPGPDHEAPTFERYAVLDRDGWEATRLTVSSHVGTHLDAPSHFAAGGATVDEIALDVLTGPAQVIHLDGLAEREPVGVDQLGEITSDRVLLHTGWDSHGCNEATYFGRHPYLSDEAGEHLVRAGVRLVGIDTPSVDYDPPSAVHYGLLSSGAVIVENLTGLAQLGDTCELTVLPLRLVGVDGSPVRAIATPSDRRRT